MELGGLFSDYGNSFADWGDTGAGDSYGSLLSQWRSGEHTDFSNFSGPREWYAGANETPPHFSFRGSNRLADLAHMFMTGYTPGEMYTASNRAQAPTTALAPAWAHFSGRYDDDKRMHAMAGYGLAQRFGRWPAYFAGFGKEMVDWVGGQGFDYQDLVANQVGINAANPYGMTLPSFGW